MWALGHWAGPVENRPVAHGSPPAMRLPIGRDHPALAQAHRLHQDAELALVAADQPQLLLGHDRHCLAVRRSARAAADAVQVGHALARRIHVDDVRDAQDVEPARADVGGDRIAVAQVRAAA